VGAIARFEQAFLALCKQRPLSRSLTFTDAGLVLGAGPLSLPCGAMAKVRKPSIFPARTAYWRCSRQLSRHRSMPPCSPNYSMHRRFGRRATKASRKSIWNICACQSLKNGEQAFRLFPRRSSDRVGPLSTRSLQGFGFRSAKGLRKFDSDQPRDDHGRWTSGGGRRESGFGGGPVRSRCFFTVSYIRERFGWHQ